MSRIIDRFRPAPPTSRRAAVQVFESYQTGQTETAPSFMSMTQGAYHSNSIVHACIGARAKVFSEARAAWRRYRNGELWTSETLRILEAPWPAGTLTELLWRMEQDASIAGNAYVYRAGPNTLQRLRPDKVQVMSDGRQKMGYLYWPDGVGQGKSVGLLLNEVAHWAPITDPAKNFIGMSWLQPIIAEIQSDQKMIGHQAKFLDNAATPNLFVQVEGRLSPDNREQLRTEFDQKYSGWKNAYRTVVLDQGADMQVVGADMQQMDFVNTLKSGETRICSAAGVPPIVVGIKAGLDAATYSNYAMAFRAFADITIRPNWDSAFASLATIVDVPPGSELWYDDTDVPALQQDQKDQAGIRKEDALTIESLIRAGFTPDTAVAAVTTDDMTALTHTGLYSVQLQPPTTETEPAPDMTATPEEATP